MKVVVESAIDLTDKQAKEIEKRFKGAWGEKVQVVFSVDPNIIGGLRIVSPQKTLDLSLAAKLNQLNKALQTT